MAKEYAVTRQPKMPPIHPGAILRDDVLPALRMPVSQAARELRVSRQTLHGILTERKGITPEMALRIGKFAGNGPDLWLRMQQAHDLWRLQRELAEELAKIPEHVAA